MKRIVMIVLVGGMVVGMQGLLYAEMIQQKPGIQKSSPIGSYSSAEYASLVENLKKNAGTIIDQSKILVPEVVKIVNASSEGGITGFVKSVVSTALDSKTRDAIVTLTGTIGSTISDINKLKDAPGQDKEKARRVLLALSTDPDVKKLEETVGSLPVVGGLLRDRLHDLIIAIANFKV